MKIERLLLTALVFVIGLLLELHAIHAYVVRATHVIQGFGARQSQATRSPTAAGIRQ